MGDLRTYPSFPCDSSYEQVIDELRQWHTTIVARLDQMSNGILHDLSTTLDDVHYFASLANALLIEQESQLKRAISSDEMNAIEERINHILSEVQLLQSLSFHLDCQTVQLTGTLHIKYNETELTSDHPLIMSSMPRPISDSSDLSLNAERVSASAHTYRFLISRKDAVELDKISSPVLHLTSFDSALIDECVLTFNLPDLDSFLHEFTTYWNVFPNNHAVRLLLSAADLSLVMGSSAERLAYLSQRFQLTGMRVFPDFCPCSEEKVLLLAGKRRELIKDCIEEIYYNIEEKNRDDDAKQTIQLYNPANLPVTSDCTRRNLNYGGVLSNRNLSRSNGIAEDDNSDEDLWTENDEWWHYQSSRDNRFEMIQREMSVSNIQAGVIIGLNASRIDRIKQITGAYVYINGDTKDPKRTVFIKGTREQVDRAYACIENLLERHKNGKLPMKPRSAHEKQRGK